MDSLCFIGPLPMASLGFFGDLSHVNWFLKTHWVSRVSLPWDPLGLLARGAAPRCRRQRHPVPPARLARSSASGAGVRAAGATATAVADGAGASASAAAPPAPRSTNAGNATGAGVGPLLVALAPTAPPWFAALPAALACAASAGGDGAATLALRRRPWLQRRWRLRCVTPAMAAPAPAPPAMTMASPAPCASGSGASASASVPAPGVGGAVSATRAGMAPGAEPPAAPALHMAPAVGWRRRFSSEIHTLQHFGAEARKNKHISAQKAPKR